MRIQLHLGLTIALSGLSLAQPVTGDFYSFQAALVAPVTELPTAYSGSGLAWVECRGRLERLGTLLQARGFGEQRNASLDEGVTVTRWYDPVTDSTVVAWMVPSGTQHDLGIGVYTGKRRWNEMIPY
jgi:hypothetical protein